MGKNEEKNISNIFLDKNFEIHLENSLNNKNSENLNLILKSKKNKEQIFIELNFIPVKFIILTE